MFWMLYGYVLNNLWCMVMIPIRLWLSDKKFKFRTFNDKFWKKRITISNAATFLAFQPVNLKVNINIKASQFQIRQCTAVSIIHLKHLIGIINIKGSKPDSAFNELKLMSSNVTITNGKALFSTKLKWNEIEHQELHVQL